MDHLDGPPLPLREGGAQGLVAPDDLAEDAGEEVRIEAAEEAQAGRQVVDRALRLDLVDDPEALLGKGGREGAAVPRLARDRLADDVPARRRRGPLDPGGHAGRR